MPGEGRAPWRRRLWLSGVMLLAASIARGDEPPAPSARLVCPRRPGPGRIVCEAELELDRGVLVWADVLVLEAPQFAPPLRARVGPSALHMKSDQRQRLQLALAATAPGSGTLRVRARAVACPDATLRGCWSLVREAQARVEVGPITD
ncbi:MAG TPA: hypothetical protein VNN80_26600 [Polyangiaceae bacterium]|nr:hypothetical protein [Polyangiaceae bacterium]